MNDIVSVVIPVFNVEKYIAKCIESLISQTYKKLEIILVDDGSTDYSGKICDEYSKLDNRIFVIHKENGGVSSARNIGMKKTTGSWVSFVDSDDWIETDFIEQLLSEGTKEEADVVLCGYNRVNLNDKCAINATGDKEIYNSMDYLIKTLNPQTGFGFCHMKLIKKEILERIIF